MGFQEHFSNVYDLKTEVMKSIGLDPGHQCSILSVNRKKFNKDEKAFLFMRHLVDNGIKNVEVIIQPSIRILIHIKRPFSGIVESYTHDAGFMTKKQFKGMLKSKSKTEKLCSEVTKDDSTQYSLIGMNDKMIDLKNYVFDYFASYPMEVIMILTYMPYVTVNFYFLDKTVASRAFSMGQKLLGIINFGKKKVEEHNMNVNVKKPSYKVYSYSIQGCLEEHRDLELLIRNNDVTVMNAIPLSDTCVNRDTNVLNLYYLNHKPTFFNFDADVYGPDGALVVKYKIGIDYDPKARLSYIKEEILNRLLKDGHILGANELFFIKLSNRRGQNATDDMMLNDVVDVMQEQKAGSVPLFRVAVNPKFDVIYRDRDGKMDKFKIQMKKTNPTKRDFTDAVDEALHEKHLLKPQEHIRSVKIHPRNKRHKVNFNVDLRSDDSGHYPPGTRADQIAAETDLRVEIPVEFQYQNGRVLKFKIYADYGADDDEIERLIRKELKKRGLKGKVDGLHFDVKNSKRNEIGEFWEGGPDVDKFVITSEPANDVEVDGDIHGTHFTTHVKVHPRETMDQLRSDVIRNVKRGNPKIKVWLEEDPSHEDEVNTVVSDFSGRVYGDDELGSNFLFDRSGKIRIGVSDHPFTLVWLNPITREEHQFCLARAPNGRCRPLPPKLANFPISDFVTHLTKVMKSEGKFEELVLRPVKSGNPFTQVIRLKEVRTVNGHRFSCAELPPDASFNLIEYVLNVDLSEVSAMVFTLMTSDERDNLNERERNHKRFKIVLTKDGADKESHLIDTDDFTPSQVRNLIYKNFSSVPSSDEIGDLHFMDDGDEEFEYEEFLKRKRNFEHPMRVRFSTRHEGPKLSMPDFEGVVIRPKPNETIREYFSRAVEEPIDFGLSPMHSYTVVGLDENGAYVNSDDFLDTPIHKLKNVKRVKFVKQPATRPDANVTISFQSHEPRQAPTSVEFDNEPLPTLNTKIRNFLIQVPPEQMGNVTIEVDNNVLKCSLETLRDAYMIKNLTVDRLFALCQGLDRQKGFSHVKMRFNAAPEGGKGNDLLDDLGSPTSSPVAKFTLFKGQSDLGLSTLVKINVGSLNSPMAEFYTKINQMFGDSVNLVSVNLALVKNGRMFPCNGSKVLRGLKDFAKVTLGKVFQICNLPAVVPPNGAFYHFHVFVDFNAQTGGSGAKTIPMDIYYDEDDRMTNVEHDENLYPEILNYFETNPDLDYTHPNKYKVTFKAQEPNYSFLTKTYNMEQMPHDITLDTVFPNTKVSGLNITIDDKDGANSGVWRSESVHPVNDFKSNFDALKRQIILNLKTMHGNNLDTIDSYVVKVGINGVKHQCHVESLQRLVSMTLDDFLKNCVNIEEINNNPSMSFGVGYEPKIRSPTLFNVKVICADKSVLTADSLGPNDTIPAKLVGELKAKYGQFLQNVQWGAYINKVQGDCHFRALLDLVDMKSVLSICGVDDPSSKHYSIVFFDMNYESFKVYNSNAKGEGLNVKVVNDTVSGLKSPVRISMPFSYSGPDIRVQGTETLNDFVREIVNNEDEFNPGNPFRLNVHTNYGTFGVDQLPRNVVNHASRDLNGTVSFIVEDDPEGNEPGTLLNLHFPDSNQTFGDFVGDLASKPGNANKRFYFASKTTFIPCSRVPSEILHTPIDELKKHGFFLTVINESKAPEQVNRLSLNVLSRDGVSVSDQVSNLQEQVGNLFAKMTKNKADLDKMLRGKFKVMVDGFERECNLANFGHGLTLEALLGACGVEDLDRSHVLTIFFETPISGEKRLKLDVDLNDKGQGAEDVDFSSEFKVGKDVEEFLRSKSDAHVYLDVKGKGVKDFVEVDSLKFLQLLKGHPEVVDMLLRLGIPQTHLGSLESLHLIISNLTKSLKGHQFFNIDKGEDRPYDMEKAVNSYPEIVELRDKLNATPELRVKGIFTLADGSKQEFDIKGREFIHAVDGGLTFREVSLRALSSKDSNNVIHINFSPYEQDEQVDSSGSSERRKRFTKTRGTPASGRNNRVLSDTEVVKSNQPSGLSSEKQGKDKLPFPFNSSTRKSEIKLHEKRSMTEPESDSDDSMIRLNRLDRKLSDVKSRYGKLEERGADSDSSNGSVKSNSSMKSVKLFNSVLRDPEKKVGVRVKTKNGKVYNLIIKASMIKRGIESGNDMKRLLQHYIANNDVENVVEIEVSEKIGSVFTVPLKKHVKITLPIIASDKPNQCDIQDFKNPWNPPEADWKNFTVKSAVTAYSNANNITDKPKAVYLLNKEDHDNLSAEIIFDEDHPQDDQKLNRKVGDDISQGKTLFIRFKDTGELAE